MTRCAVCGRAVAGTNQHRVDWLVGEARAESDYICDRGRCQSIQRRADALADGVCAVRFAAYLREEFELYSGGDR